MPHPALCTLTGRVVCFCQTLQISDAGRPKDLSQDIYKHMAEMTILVTQLVVEFAKRLPGFCSLEKDDQIILLKVCMQWRESFLR